MKLCIIGYGRHGKDTCAEIITNKTGLKSLSSSMFCSEKIVFPKLKNLYGYINPEDCFNDRSNHRKEWYELIKDYCKNDLTRLTREIIENSDIYIGIRDIHEFKASKHLFDLVIWVDASERLVPESVDSCTVTKDCADIIIENNGTFEEFYGKVTRLIYTWNI
jgi:dephospho-CoA kinase